MTHLFDNRTGSPRTTLTVLVFALALALAVVLCLSWVMPQQANAATYAPATPKASVSASSNTAIKVKWKAVSRSKGYQVRYSTSKTMAKAKKVTAPGKSTTSIKVKDLMPKTTYYVQVRSYALNSNCTKKCSRWTTVAKVKTNYSIVYHLNGGTQASGQKTSYAKTTPTFSLREPTRQGYIFLGWFATSDCSGKQVRQIAQGSTGTKHLYASWQKRQASNAQIIFNYCIAQGMTKQCAAAIVGNAQQESGCNPESEYAAGKSYGLFQWSGSRFERLKEIAAQRDTTWKDMECQLILLMEELPGQFQVFTGWELSYENGTAYGWRDKVSFAQWCTWTDIAKATACFEQVYERAGIPRMEQRISYANAAYRAYA